MLGTGSVSRRPDSPNPGPRTRLDTPKQGVAFSPSLPKGSRQPQQRARTNVFGRRTSQRAIRCGRAFEITSKLESLRGVEGVGRFRRPDWQLRLIEQMLSRGGLNTPRGHRHHHRVVAGQDRHGVGGTAQLPLGGGHGLLDFGYRAIGGAFATLRDTPGLDLAILFE